MVCHLGKTPGVERGGARADDQSSGIVRRLRLGGMQAQACANRDLHHNM